VQQQGHFATLCDRAKHKELKVMLHIRISNKHAADFTFSPQKINHTGPCTFFFKSPAAAAAQ
jgi:hypothetical protein